MLAFFLLCFTAIDGDDSVAAASNGDQSSSNDQPCDLRLLIPDTCLKELVNNKPIKIDPYDVANTSHNDINNALSISLTKIEKLKSPTGYSSRNCGGGGSGLYVTLNNNNNSSTTSRTDLTPVTMGGAYKCEKCTNSYARLHSLNRHLRFECGVEPQFECPVCHKKSKHKHNLVLHMRTHQQR